MQTQNQLTPAQQPQRKRKITPLGLPENWLRILSDYIEDANGCRIWQGAPYGSFGYGRVSIGPRGGKKVYQAHRFSWMTFRGPIPAGLCVLHKCDVPLCINPEHLFIGTKADNTHDAQAKGRLRNQNTGRTVCHKGHPLVGNNVFVTGRKGFRRCRTCHRAYVAAWMRAKKQQGKLV